MKVNYDHSRDAHSCSGPQAALPLLLKVAQPKSILDVGCGTGTWLKAACDLGVTDVCGVDGIDIPAAKLLFP